MSIRSIFRRRGDVESWQAGDLAECVHRGRWYHKGKPAKSEGPAFGERYVVKGLFVDSRGKVYLGFARFWPRSYRATCFRKVRPHADPLIAADMVFSYTVLQQPEHLS